MTSSSGVRPPSGAPLPMRPSSSFPGCTTTRSPTCTRVTSAPTQSTVPAISWPRHIGVGAGPGDAAEADVRQVAAAHATRGDPHHGVARPGRRARGRRRRARRPDRARAPAASSASAPARVRLEQEGHGVAHRRVDELEPHAEVVEPVVRERDRCVGRRSRPHSCSGQPDAESDAVASANPSVQKPRWCRFECSLRTQTVPGVSSMSSMHGSPVE